MVYTASRGDNQAMLNMKIEIDTDKMLRMVDGFRGDQVKFSIAKALTKTAQDAQAAVRESMKPPKFTIRRQWIVNGIRIIAAKKNDLTAVVYSRDGDFMGRQETGGTKTPKRDSNLALPLSAVRRTKADIIKAQDLPNNLGQAQINLRTKGGKIKSIKGAGGSVFKMQVNGRTIIARRRGKKDIELMYVLVPRANIKPRLGLHEIGQRVVNQNFGQNLRDAMVYAMQTPK